MRDTYSDFKAAIAIAAAALDADPTPPAIDRQGYDAVTFLLSIGAGGITFSGTNKIEFKLTHSDDDVTYDAVDLGDVLGVASVGEGGIVKALVAAHAAAGVYRFGYKGGRRYLKLLPDFSGTHGVPTPIAAVALLGHGFNKPEAAQI